MGQDTPVSILSNDKKDLSDNWKLFLSDTEISCPVKVTQAVATTTPPPPDAPPNFTCTNGRFWDLQFDTAKNSTRFKTPSPYVGDDHTALIGLASPLGDTTAFAKPVSDVLLKFGVIPSGLVATILSDKAIPPTAMLKLDTTETRNVVWCTPGQTLQTSTALTFMLDNEAGLLAKVTTVLREEFSISLDTFDSLRFHFQRTSAGVPIVEKSKDASGVETARKGIHITSTYSLAISLSLGGFVFWVKLSPAGITCSMTQDPKVDGTLWDRLDKLVTPGNNAPSQAASKPTWEKIADHFDLLSISVGKGGSGVWWQIKTIIQFAGDSGPVFIFLTYDSRTSTFSGGLAVRSSFPSDVELLRPTFEPGSDVLPKFTDTTVIPDQWAVGQLVTEFKQLPKEIPTIISVATFSFANTVPKNLSLSLSLIRESATASASEVPAPFDWEQISLEANIGTGFSGKAWALFSLNPRPEDKKNYLPADLSLGLTYSSGTWQLFGHADNLSVGLLWSFFEKDLSGPLVEVLGKLSISSLDLQYTYAPGGSATSFLFMGTITLGTLELRMFYQYTTTEAEKGASAAKQVLAGLSPPGPPTVPLNGATSAWAFECDLGSSKPGSTLGTIVDSIIDDAAGLLPDFVANIPIEPASGNNRLITLKVNKTGSGDTQAIVFQFIVKIAGFTLTFIQIKAKDPAKPARRLFRISVDKIPLIDSIPLIGQLPQPFDQLIYMWVSSSAEFTKSDVDQANLFLEDGEKLMFKQVKSKPAPDDIVIQKGHHFVVINDSTVTLDHVFGVGKDEITKKSEAASDTLVKPSLAPSTTLAPPATNDTPTNTPSKGSLTKTLGPLAISAVTLEYKDKALWVSCNATLTMGPFAIELLGFGIGVPTTNLKLNDLGGVASHIMFELHGLSLSFNKPPLLIAGAFEHDLLSLADGSHQDIYKGGVGIGFPPYTFVGVGEYAVVTKGNEEYKSIFIFAKLDGPLITLEFATISGVRLGFGFNSVVRSPTIDQLTEFPFINNPGTGSPMDILKSMTDSKSKDPINDPPWVTPKRDSYWLAAGFTVTAFDVLAITAVAMFAFRDAGIIISIFADAVAQMPPDVKSQSEMILYIEIGIVAEMNLVDGYFRVEASLAPSSFILVPQCHVWGGFALVYWFGPSPHAGDWVFSIGGYHKNYVVPLHYPNPVTRVGISFPVGACMSVTGNSYFAITPKVAMAGALIHVTLSVGPVKAWLDASFDALINFHPMHYVVDFRVSIGVEFDLDILFIHIHISCSVGADLHIEGPEFGGVAHVDFYLFGFDVYFGDSNHIPDPISLPDFWKITHQPGPDASSRPDNDPNPLLSCLQSPSDAKPMAPPVSGAAFKAILEDGNFPMPSPVATSATAKANVPSTGAGAKWFVKGGTFKFRLASDFALSQAIVKAPDAASVIKLDTTDTQKIFSRPMHVSDAITSVMTVTITKISTNTIESGWQNAQFYLKPVPTAMWASYDPHFDPLKNRNASDLLGGSNPTVTLAMGILLSAPKPILAEAKIPKFKASAAAQHPVLDSRSVKDPIKEVGTNWILAEPEKIQVSLLAAPLTDKEKTQSKKDHWADFKNMWKGLGSKQDVLVDKTGVMAQCADVFEWSAKRPPAEAVAKPAGGGGAANKVSSAVREPWELVGRLPMKLVGRLESTYLALPRVAVV
ncbi:hypothetical protein MMC30_005405 [Trapelia coarctata]|nr:hypothetical protein [Trapelia coarctata]